MNKEWPYQNEKRLWRFKKEDLKEDCEDLSDFLKQKFKKWKFVNLKKILGNYCKILKCNLIV